MMRLFFEGVSIELCWGLTYVPPDPQWSIASHSHTVFEGHFVVEGKGINCLRDEELELYPDIVYLAPPHEIHAQRSDPDSPVSLYFIGFQLAFDDKRRQLPRIYSRLPFVRQELESILQLKQYSSVGSKFKLQLRLLELLWEILEPVIYCPTEDKREKQTFIPKYYVDKAMAYTEDHLLEHPSIEEIAASCNITPRHLTRIFSKTANISVHDYVQHERFSWALSQLRNTSLTVHEISDMLNFSSTQYFIRWFKKFAQVSPLEFRNQQNK